MSPRASPRLPPPPPPRGGAGCPRLPRDTASPRPGPGGGGGHGCTCRHGSARLSPARHSSAQPCRQPRRRARRCRGALRPAGTAAAPPAATQVGRDAAGPSFRARGGTPEGGLGSPVPPPRLRDPRRGAAAAPGVGSPRPPPPRGTPRAPGAPRGAARPPPCSRGARSWAGAGSLVGPAAGSWAAAGGAGGARSSLGGARPGGGGSARGALPAAAGPRHSQRRATARGENGAPGAPLERGDAARAAMGNEPKLSGFLFSPLHPSFVAQLGQGSAFPELLGRAGSGELAADWALALAQVGRARCTWAVPSAAFRGWGARGGPAARGGAGSGSSSCLLAAPASPEAGKVKPEEAAGALRRAARPACPCLLQPAVWAVPCLQHRQRSALLEPRDLIPLQPGPPTPTSLGSGSPPRSRRALSMTRFL